MPQPISFKEHLPEDLTEAEERLISHISNRFDLRYHYQQDEKNKVRLEGELQGIRAALSCLYPDERFSKLVFAIADEMAQRHPEY